ncbi:uncharacterized protein LOC115734227 [Rhodamnia argentea]|uniref:Uncharacterized protein LOC115734227 n=1 Tax=Rhodamnia argentea TaxID=178133 RepID=A0A8B8NE65_9MYRT|nr:uncharacterized protein LOC115734227 [Rhodamnia argentea]
MTVLLLNDQTILDFVSDKEAIGAAAGERFRVLDVDRDGLLSRDDLRRGFDSCIALDHERGAEEGNDGLFDAVFDRSDKNKDGAIDPEEFKGFVAEIMLGLARGLGGVPVTMVLQEDSLFIKAVEHELEQRKKVPTAAASVSTPRSIAKERKHKPRLGLFLCFCGDQSAKHHGREQIHHLPEMDR